MALSKPVVQADHLSIELGTNVQDGILNSVRNMNATCKYSKTVTQKDIYGVKNLSFSETIIFGTNGNTTVVSSYDYVCDLNDDLELKITGKYSNGKITVPVMITHKKQKWSLGCEIILTFNPLELIRNGLYIVGSMPLYGTQVVIKYNIVTKDFVILFRMPLPQGNEEDKKGAAEARCNLIYLDIDYAKDKIYEKCYEYDTIKHYDYNYNHNTNVDSDLNRNRDTNTNTNTNTNTDRISLVDGIRNMLSNLVKPKETDRNIQYN